MQSYIIIPLIGLLTLSACSKKNSEVAESEIKEVDFLEGRIYPDTEYCIIQHTSRGPSGAFSTMPKDSWSIGDQRGIATSSEAASYSLNLTFLGHQNDVDIYTVKIEAPGHSSKPFELRYLGAEIELYKDGEYVIILRPRLTELNQSAEQDAAPNL